MPNFKPWLWREVRLIELRILDTIAHHYSIKKCPSSKERVGRGSMWRHPIKTSKQLKLVSWLVDVTSFLDPTLSFELGRSWIEQWRAIVSRIRSSKSRTSSRFNSHTFLEEMVFSHVTDKWSCWFEETKMTIFLKIVFVSPRVISVHQEDRHFSVQVH